MSLAANSPQPFPNAYVSAVGITPSDLAAFPASKGLHLAVGTGRNVFVVTAAGDITQIYLAPGQVMALSIIGVPATGNAGLTAGQLVVLY